MTPRYNTYVLGGTPEIDLTAYDKNNNTFTPTEARLSIKQPDGAIVTYSGGDLTQGSGFLYLLYRPPVIGWYEYEGWVKDPNGREVSSTNGFDVIDRVY